MLRSISKIAIVCTMVACAESARENIIDPVVAPTIEMSDPVLDGGSVLIAWRYLSEGSALSEFRVTRTAGDVTAEVGRVTASATVGVEWGTASLRDSSLVAGVRITYRVTAILGGGVSSSTASNSILIEGTTLNLKAYDVNTLAIQLEWSGAPSGAIGFQVRRTAAGGSAETVFETDDATVTSFDDTNLTGNTTYTYELITLLDGGGELGSTTVEAARFGYFRTNTVGNTLGAGKLLLFAVPFNMLAVVGDTEARMVDDAANRQWWSYDLGVDYIPATVSISGGLARHRDVGLWMYAFGMTAGNEMAFAVHSGDVVTGNVDTVLVWPSAGGTVTGVRHFADQIIVYEGTTARVIEKKLNTGFEVVETGTFETGEPIDIDYADASLWLAYPDRLLRSRPNGVTKLADISEWESVPLPEGATITAITQIQFVEGVLVLLDGTNGRLHLIDGEGKVLTSWDALGGNLESGDVQAYSAVLGWVAQADGDGNMYSFDPEGFR